MKKNILLLIVGAMLLIPLRGETPGGTDLSSAEKFLLLQLNPESGNYVSNTHEIEMGLAGVLLLDLENRGKFAPQGKKIVLLDREPTGNALLDQVLEKMAKAKKKRRLSSWVGRIGDRSDKYERMVLGDLIAKGIIAKKRKKTFIFFRKTVYPVLQGEIREALRQEWRQRINNPDALTPFEKEWIGILYASDLERVIFPTRAEFKTVKAQFKMIYKNSRFGQAVRSSISSEDSSDTNIVGVGII